MTGKRGSMRIASAVALACALYAGPSAADERVFLLQLGSFESRAEAQNRWRELQQDYPELMEGLSVRLLDVTLPPDDFTVYRTQAGALYNRSDAQIICDKLTKSGDECYVVETAMFDPAELQKQPQPSPPSMPAGEQEPDRIADATPEPFAEAAASAGTLTAAQAPDPEPLDEMAEYDTSLTPDMEVERDFDPEADIDADATAKVVRPGANSQDPRAENPTNFVSAQEQIDRDLRMSGGNVERAMEEMEAMLAQAEANRSEGRAAVPVIPQAPLDKGRAVASSAGTMLAGASSATASGEAQAEQTPTDEPTIWQQINPFDDGPEESTESESTSAASMSEQSRNMQMAQVGQVADQDFSQRPLPWQNQPSGSTANAGATASRNMNATPQTLIPAQAAAPQPRMTARPMRQAPSRPARYEPATSTAQSPLPPPPAPPANRRLPPAAFKAAPPVESVPSMQAYAPEPRSMQSMPATRLPRRTPAFPANMPFQVKDAEGRAVDIDGNFIGERGDVRVAEAIPVPLSDVQRSSPPPATPQRLRTLGLPSNTARQKAMWAEVSYFNTQQQALAFWDNFRLAHPDFPPMRVRITNPFLSSVDSDPQVTLRVGPFEHRYMIDQLCGVLSDDETRCEMIQDLGASVSRHARRNDGHESRRVALLRERITQREPMYWVQVGSFDSQSAAYSAWNHLQQLHEPLLDRMEPDVATPVQTSSMNSKYRLRAGPFIMRPDADALCRSLKNGGTKCLTIFSR